MSQGWTPLLLAAALAVLSAPFGLSSAAWAQDLAGAPQTYDVPPGYGAAAGPSGVPVGPIGGPPVAGPPMMAPPMMAQAMPGPQMGPAIGPSPEALEAHAARRAMREAADHPKECYAHVRIGATYAPPPTGPEYVWRQAPAPPGAPGPVWCLVVAPFPQQPVMISPEHMGWIRVLCADETTPARVSQMQRRLYEQGLYSGGFEGRYDMATASAVARFQQAQRIADDGYLGYRTVAAIEALPPRRIYLRRPTTFDTGVLNWSGKVQRF
jgi:hypothetical protein